MYNSIAMQINLNIEQTQRELSQLAEVLRTSQKRLGEMAEAVSAFKRRDNLIPAEDLRAQLAAIQANRQLPAFCRHANITSTWAHQFLAGRIKAPGAVIYVRLVRGLETFTED